MTNAPAPAGAESWYRSLFEQHPDAIYTLDRDGRFLSVNPTALRMLGIPWRELEHQSFVPFVEPEFATLALTRFRQALAGTASNYELAVRASAGQRLELAITNVPIVTPDGITGVFGIARDLSEQRALEAQLRDAQRLESLGKLAGGIAHDFNNLVTIVQLHTELLLDTTPAGDDRRGDLLAIRAATERAALLTRQLLAVGRKQLLRPEPLDLNAVVQQLLPMIERASGAEVAVHVDLDPSLGMVLADRGQVEQVLLNLVLNAVDAMRGSASGRLSIATRNAQLEDAVIDGVHTVAGSYVRLSVGDTGSGMTPEVRARVFEPFFTTKAVGEGAGLGLSTALGIAHQSGGYLFCDSQPGAGTTFSLILPRTTAGVAAILEPTEVEGAHGTETVLVVEDEAAVRALATRILRGRGYTVLAAADGREALDLLTWHTGPIDLVLTDAVMPGVGGAELARLLARLRPGVPVLFMSGYTDDEIIRRGLATDPDMLLQKPFTAAQLTRRVRAMIDAAAARRDG